MNWFTKRYDTELLRDFGRFAGGALGLALIGVALIVGAMFIWIPLGCFVALLIVVAAVLESVRRPGSP